MARLAAVEKALFYATPDAVAGVIARLVRPLGASRILDPCAGEGRAVRILGHAWGLKAYGIELDAGRAAAATACGVQCLNGSIHSLDATEGAFGAVFLNPPYDDGASDDGVSIRQEVQFLRESVRWLSMGGLLVYIPPAHILHNARFAETIRRWFRNISIFRFPDPHFERFKQHVVLAQRGASDYVYGSYAPPDDETPAAILGEVPYELGAPINETALSTFALAGRAPELTAPRLAGTDDAGAGAAGAATGCYALPQYRTLLGGGERYDLRPLLPLRPGHRALLLAAGCLDGAELSPGVLVKGSSEKVVDARVDIDAEKAYRTERIVSRLATLDLTSGSLTHIRTDEEPEVTAAWFEEHAAALSRVVAEAYPPTFHGDLTRFDFSGLRAPGILPGKAEPEILEVQKRAAAAVAWWWRAGHKSAVISGEMGVGKTTVGAAAVMLAKAPKTVIMCPSHLVAKWVREAAMVTGTKAVAAKGLRDVDRFFADPKARFLVLSKDQAKLGAKWRPAFVACKVRIEQEVTRYPEDDETLAGGSRWYDRTPVKEMVREWVEGVACPRCGEVQMAHDLHVTAAMLAEQKTYCCKTACREPLWQVAPISAKGTKRWAPAKYINQRYAGRFVVVIDECHHVAGSDSDQSRAAQLLASAATKLLAMTGTLYGGRASSLFHILYKVDREFRRLYRFDATQEFVAHHGLFETVMDIKEATSVYGYKRGNAGGRVREIPGASPSMIKLLLNYTIFIRLPDLGVELPPFTERVELVDHDPEVLAAVQAMQRECQTVLRKHPRVLGQYLQACLGYPDRPDQAEEIRDVDWNGEPRGDLLASAPAFPGQEWPKDRRVVEIVLAEKAKGRQVLVYFTQTQRRDARPRVQRLLEEAGLRVAVLEASVTPGKREEWVAKAVEKGVDVLLTNGRLVETGLDLLWAKTIIQYGVEYNVRSLRQSTRRSWRLGQTDAVEVIYLAYRGTAQEAALALIAKKMRAAELLDGEEAGGLAQHDTTGNDFFLELAREVSGGTGLQAA